MEYYCYQCNRKACRDKDWKTLIDIALGETPDISALLKFSFWQELIYLSFDKYFPDTKQGMNSFLGVFEKRGDA